MMVMVQHIPNLLRETAPPPCLCVLLVYSVVLSFVVATVGRRRRGYCDLGVLWGIVALGCGDALELVVCGVALCVDACGGVGGGAFEKVVVVGLLVGAVEGGEVGLVGGRGLCVVG